MKNETLNTENIDEIRAKLHNSFFDPIKSNILDIIESFYEEKLENKEITLNQVNTIANNILESKEFNKFIDDYIYQELSSEIEKSKLREEEEL